MFLFFKANFSTVELVFPIISGSLAFLSIISLIFLNDDNDYLSMFFVLCIFVCNEVRMIWLISTEEISLLGILTLLICYLINVFFIIFFTNNKIEPQSKMYKIFIFFLMLAHLSFSIIILVTHFIDNTIFKDITLLFGAIGLLIICIISTNMVYTHYLNIDNPKHI